jgi:hypothetical protein
LAVSDSAPDFRRFDAWGAGSKTSLCSISGGDGQTGPPLTTEDEEVLTGAEYKTERSRLNNEGFSVRVKYHSGQLLPHLATIV